MPASDKERYASPGKGLSHFVARFWGADPVNLYPAGEGAVRDSGQGVACGVLGLTRIASQLKLRNAIGSAATRFTPNSPRALRCVTRGEHWLRAALRGSLWNRKGAWHKAF